MTNGLKSEGQIKLGGSSVRFNNPIASVALVLILLGVLLPTANYSMNLRDPTPEELLVAVCLALFSGVVFLWVLDATSVLKFRAEWIAKSVYGAAITSVLGTSVGVYRDAFSERKYPFEGEWNLMVEPSDKMYLIGDHKIVLHHSTDAETYWGFSNMLPNLRAESKKYPWLAIEDFRPKDQELTMRLLQQTGAEMMLSFKVKRERAGKRFVGTTTPDAKYHITMTRPR